MYNAFTGEHYCTYTTHHTPHTTLFLLFPFSPLLSAGAGRVRGTRTSNLKEGTGPPALLVVCCWWFVLVVAPPATPSLRASTSYFLTSTIGFGGDILFLSKSNAILCFFMVIQHLISFVRSWQGVGRLGPPRQRQHILRSNWV